MGAASLGILFQNSAGHLGFLFLFRWPRTAAPPPCARIGRMDGGELLAVVFSFFYSMLYLFYS